MSRQNRLLTSRATRFFKLSGLTARVSSSYTGQKVRELFLGTEERMDSRTLSHVRNAERIVRTLGELKGAVMKVGQYVSIQSDLLPKEFADVLASLQKDAPPVDYELVAGQITRELGKPPDALFASFDPKPYASASIGQVHRARLADGTEVVVKVQYPGVEENIEGDLGNLKTILSMGSLFGYKKRDLDGIFDEIRERLEEELDYDQEMENAKLFRKELGGDERLIIPRVFPPYCSERVLTLEYVPGDPFEALQSPPYTQEDRNRFGRLIFDLYAQQILEIGLLHADPHPGNFAFRRDGRLVMYDYGCVQRISEHIRETCRKLIRYGLEGRYDRIDGGLLELGFRDPAKKPLDPDFYRRFCEVYQIPFLPGQEHEFGTIDVIEKARELAPLGLSKMLHFKPVRDMVFIERAVGGHYGNLRTLRAKACWRDILDPYLEG